MVKNPPANAGDVTDAGSILGQEDPLEEEMATHSSIHAWRISRTEEPGGLQTMQTEEPGGLQTMDSQKNQTRLSAHIHTA